MLEQLADYHPLLPAAAGLLLLALAALVGDLVCKRFMLQAARLLAKRSKATWDDAMVEFNVFGRLAQLVPGLIIAAGIGLVPGIPEHLDTLILNVANGYIVLMATLTLTAILSAANLIYEGRPESRQRPIKGFIQLIQIIVVVIGVILIIASLLDRSPTLLLSGLGAMTAVLMLVFKDTILSLVASVQLTAQDMVRVGDWIEMPQYGADGDVIDVELHMIRVQNWDKTITTIPTHRLISDSFKNWRGMSEAGARRIKRAIYLDTGSIRFLTAEEAARYKRFTLLGDYIDNKQRDLQSHNADQGDGEVNFRRLTNVGTFRAYVENYLKANSHIHKGMTLLVRQLPPGPEGLPIEIYCFTNTTNWNAYEGIQSDIFDHFLAIVPEFDLRLYQKPSGQDLGAALATTE